MVVLIRDVEEVTSNHQGQNILGAEKAGIKGYLFDGDAKKLKNYLDAC